MRLSERLTFWLCTTYHADIRMRSIYLYERLTVVSLPSLTQVHMHHPSPQGTHKVLDDMTLSSRVQG